MGKKLQFVTFNFQIVSGVIPWKGIGIYELPTYSTSAAQYFSNRAGATQQGYKILGYYTLPKHNRRRHFRPFNHYEYRARCQNVDSSYLSRR